MKNGAGEERRKGVRAYGHKGRRQDTKVYKVQRRKGVKA